MTSTKSQPKIRWTALDLDVGFFGIEKLHSKCTFSGVETADSLSLKKKMGMTLKSK